MEFILGGDSIPVAKPYIVLIFGRYKLYYISITGRLLFKNHMLFRDVVC